MTILNADRWITSVLEGDPVVASVVGDRIYPDQAPMETAYPLIIFNFVSSLPVSNASADKVMDDEIWRIKVITDDPTYKGLETLADRIREIFHKASGTGIIGCVSNSIYRLPESKDGQFYKTIILEFELFTQ